MHLRKGIGFLQKRRQGNGNLEKLFGRAQNGKKRENESFTFFF